MREFLECEARTYTMQRKFRWAADGFKRVVDLRPNDAQALADHAEALTMRNNRTLEGEPENLIMQAGKLDPANVKALSLARTAPTQPGGLRVEIGGNAR